MTLFEKRDRLGGHTSTVVIPSGPDAGLAVDTGFIVLNDRTYPHFHQFLGQLGVPVRESCMSFGYYCEDTNFCYAGTDLNGLFAQRRNALRPKFWGMCRAIRRFGIQAKAALDRGELRGLSLGQYLQNERYGTFFRENYLVPLSAAIWSSSDLGILEFPAEMFVHFFHNHGLLALTDRPTWQTVVGGSHSYLKAFEAQFPGDIRLSSGVTSIRRDESSVQVTTAAGTERFDKVVLACHADQALGMLSDPSPQESSLLGAWTYSKNRTILHTDESVLPPWKNAWASWNSRRLKGANPDSPVSLTYHMNRLQGLDTPRQYCVTLNPGSPIDERKVVKEFHYEHPVFNLRSLSTQAELKALSGQRNTYYCGAYLANGFHEDGMNSAIAMAKKLGVELCTHKSIKPKSATAGCAR